MNAKEIKEQYNLFREKINTLFPTRSTQLNKMYDYFEERLVMLPASGVEHYHNAFPGGYIDHVLRVMDFSEREWIHWEKNGLKVDNFTLNELLFAAAHHDLGKVGMKGEYNPYQPNSSEWHRKNQGKIYNHDSAQPFMLVPDLSIFTLQQFGVPMSWSEFLAIRTHDGVYDRANEAYYFSHGLDSKARTNINQILHNADFMAGRFEFERWANENPTKFKFYYSDATDTPQPVIPTQVTKKPLNMDELDDLFKEFEL